MRSFSLFALSLMLAGLLAAPAQAAQVCGLYPSIPGVEGLPYCAAAYTLYIPAVYN